jgi:acyl-CoA thioester hydrolase
MFVFDFKLRVRYGDTDQMGYVYYGNYPYYYEQARAEAVRSLGLPYKDMEAAGIMMPILRMNIKYIAPALYDELITIKTIVPEIPGRLIMFKYEIYNEQEALINEGETLLGFMDATTRKIRRAPDMMIERIEPFFKK